MTSPRTHQCDPSACEQEHFKPWSFPDHGSTKGADRDVKEILRRRHTSGRRTSGKKMYKRFTVAEADLCDAAKRLVNRGLHLNIDTEGEAKFSEEALKVKAEELDNKRKLEDDRKEEMDSDSDSEDELPLAKRKAAQKVRRPVAQDSKRAVKPSCETRRETRCETCPHATGGEAQRREPLQRLSLGADVW